MKNFDYEKTKKELQKKWIGKITPDNTKLLDIVVDQREEFQSFNRACDEYGNMWFLDELERALQTQVQEADQGFYTGVKMTYDQLIVALKNEGVEEIDCLNKKFDPNLEQAIMQEKKEGVESGLVIEVLQKGYMLKDRVLRAAMVKVSE